MICKNCQNKSFFHSRIERGRVIPEGSRLRCEVELTSKPAEYRPTVANMVYLWYTRDTLPPNGTFNLTVPDAATRLSTGESYITLDHAHNGSYYSCFGVEEGSGLWSEIGEWYQYVSYRPGPTVPGQLMLELSFTHE